MVGTKTLLLSKLLPKLAVGSGSDRRFRGAVCPWKNGGKPGYICGWLWIPARTPRADPG
jgi:hypothetical protein